MSNRLDRFEMLIGKEALDSLKEKKVIIFGIGGVGGYVLEALVRAGVGHIAIVDSDNIDITNINRQIIATTEVVGLPKVDVAEKRAKSINPDVVITKFKHFYLPEDHGGINLSDYDYVIDAIDTVKAKLDIIVECKTNNIPIISSMGAGNRLDPSKLVYADVYKTSNDPFAKIMRKECRKAGITSLAVVYSTEEAIKPLEAQNANGRHIPGSSPFVPPAAGLMIASKVIRDLLEVKHG